MACFRRRVVRNSGWSTQLCSSRRDSLQPLESALHERLDSDHFAMLAFDENPELVISLFFGPFGVVEG